MIYFSFFTIVFFFYSSELEENHSNKHNEDNSINQVESEHITVVDESIRSDDGDNSIQKSKGRIDRTSILNHEQQAPISTKRETKEKDLSETLVLSPKCDANNTSIFKKAENINGEEGGPASNANQHNGDKTETSNINGNYSYGDYEDNNMYFMEDGGYNSFNLELPCTETSGDNGSPINSCEKSVDAANDLPKESKIEKASENSNFDMVQSSSLKQMESNLINILPQDSFSVSDLKQVDVDSTAIKTPQGKHTKGGEECEFKTPRSLPSLNNSKFIDEFETPQPSKIKDKDACKNFHPGCSKHPETKEAITPMPDFAQLPTPDLKVKLLSGKTFVMLKYLMFLCFHL